MYIDHAAIKHLLTKKEAKPRLIRWFLLLRDFDYEIKEKKGSEKCVADHLLRLTLDLEKGEGNLSFVDSIKEETLISMIVKGAP